MAQPTQSDLHVNTLMTNLSLMYSQEETNFIARDVFPIIPSQHETNRYTVFSRADFNRDTMRKRAENTLVNEIGYRVDTTPTYRCELWAAGRAIGDQTRANADFVFNLDAEATKLLTTTSLINREVAWASTFFKAGVWTNNWVGGAAASSGGYPTAPATSTATAYTALKWTDPNSDPIKDIRTAIRIGQLTTAGYRFNKLVLNRTVFDGLLDHPDFVDRIKYGGTNERPGKVNLNALADLFDIDTVHIMDAVYNTAPEGVGVDSGATYAAPSYNAGINSGETNTFIGGNNALLLYTPSAPGLNTPGCGYTFVNTGYFGATPGGERISSYYFQPTRSTKIEIESFYVHKVVAPDMGLVITGIV